MKSTKYIWMFIAAIAMGGLFNVGMVALGSVFGTVLLVVVYDLVVGVTLTKGLKSKYKDYLTKTHLKILAMDVLLIALTDYLVLAYIADTGAAKAGILSLLRIGVVYILALTFLKELFDKRIFVGTIVSFTGAIIILVLPALSHVSSLQFSDFAVATGYVIAGVMIVISKPQFKYFEPTHLVGLRSFFAALLLIPVALLHGGFASISSANPISIILAVTFMFVFGALPSVLEFRALKRIRAEDAAGALLIAPAVGVVGGLLILGESFNIYSIIGSVIIVLGILISHNAHHRLYVRLKKDEEWFIRFIRTIIRRLIIIEHKLLSR